jgi:hypothetical protein
MKVRYPEFVAITIGIAAVTCLLVVYPSLWHGSELRCVGGSGQHEVNMHRAISATAILAPHTYAMASATPNDTRRIYYDIALRDNVVEHDVPHFVAVRDARFRGVSVRPHTSRVLGYFFSDWDHTYSSAICKYGHYASLFAPWHTSYSRLYRAQPPPPPPPPQQQHPWEVPPKHFPLAVTLTCLDPSNPPQQTRLVRMTASSSLARMEFELDSPLACSYQRPT